MDAALESAGRGRLRVESGEEPADRKLEAVSGPTHIGATKSVVVSATIVSLRECDMLRNGAAIGAEERRLGTSGMLVICKNRTRDSGINGLPTTVGA